MESSLPAAGVVAPRPADDKAILPPFAALWHDLPTLSRCVGHLVLFAALLLLARYVTPSEPRLPTLALWLSARPVQLTYDGEPAAITPDAAPRFLERSAVPVTVRTSGDTLPLFEPQRQVRTSVSVYTVRPGDTVLGIAQTFGLKGTSLLWANKALNDNPDFLKVGQKLNILPVDGAYHTVAKGETIEKIASSYKVQSEAIFGYGGNQLQPGAVLQLGQQLIVPGGVVPYVPRRVQVTSGPVPADAQKGSGRLVWPMSGSISQRYWEGHLALDIAAPKGTTIVAADSGYVVSTQYSDAGYGRMLIIDHGNGYRTLYAHLTSMYVAVGQSVSKGETIGTCGATGNATGPHLHFEVIKDGVKRNPLNYLP
jgi:murein DD-endopeptidase MepM/ murein hydrolase activator NlpD